MYDTDSNGTDDGTVKIQTEQKFTFVCNRELRAAYEGRAVGSKYIIDFSRTDYMTVLI